MPRNDHTAFQVSDLDAAIAFYTKVIGLGLKFKRIDEAHGEAYAFLALEGGSLELLQMLNGDFEKPVIKPPYCPHFAIETKDMAETMTRMAKQGAAVVTGPLANEEGDKWVYVSDPDNNVIEFIEWG